MHRIRGKANLESSGHGSIETVRADSRWYQMNPVHMASRFGYKTRPASVLKARVAVSPVMEMVVKVIEHILTAVCSGFAQ